MKFILLILSLATSGCIKVDLNEVKMRANEQQDVRYCMGRTVIAVPSLLAPDSITTGSFRFINLGTEEGAIDVSVDDTKMKESDFKIRVHERSAELKSAGDETTNILKHEQALDHDAYLFRVQEIDDAYVSEVIALKGGNLVTVRLHSFRNQFGIAEDQLVKLVDSIVVGGDAASLGSGGFCLGPVVVIGDFQEESGRFLYRSQNGINLKINIDTFVPDERVPLLDRVSGSESLLSKFQVKHKVLRARELTVAGMRAQEWLSWAETGPEKNQGSYGFAIETMRDKPEKLSPSLRLLMDSSQPRADGTPSTTLISDEEAIGLWNSITNSIRPATDSAHEG